MTAALSDTDRDVRKSAAEALGGIGPAAATAAPRLALALREDPDPPLEAFALSRIGPAGIQELVRALQDTDREVRLAAARYLRDGGPEADAEVVRIAGSLEHPDPEARCEAALLLSCMGPAAQAATPAIVAALKDDDERVRTQAIHALSAIGIGVVPLIPELLRGGNPLVRKGGALAVAFMASQVNGHVPLMDPDLDAALIHAGVVDRLAERLSDEDGPVRVSAADALAQIGPAAAAVPQLIESLDDQASEVREYAADALGLIGPAGSKAVDALARTLRDPVAKVREWAAIALGLIGATASAATPHLIAALEDEDADVRYRAAEALGKIAPRPPSASSP